MAGESLFNQREGYNKIIVLCSVNPRRIPEEHPKKSAEVEKVGRSFRMG